MPSISIDNLTKTYHKVRTLDRVSLTILSLLPLTHASKAIRDACLNGRADIGSWLILLITGIAFFIMAVALVEKVKD